MLRLLTIACLALLLAQHLARAEPAIVQVQSSSERGHVLLKASFRAAVPRGLAFAVLTDFDHMAEFVPNLRSSRVLARQGNVFSIAQQGEYRYGLLSFSFDSQRRIELHGLDSIAAQALDTANGQYRSLTRLSDDAGQTLVQFQADWVPANGLLASIAESYLREQVEQQFRAMLGEMGNRAARMPKSASAAAYANRVD
ncbi:SRPBCC family protein [Chitinilyticum litopenaei]|uniref:SRPBCC family protein n=1 Tax=Chitinilyticum litopenaei TaxID=1121276 RepID=UPI0003F4E6C5|nr:SRPBCC family protein [Chitinilyticum litopenaei]